MVENSLSHLRRLHLEPTTTPARKYVPERIQLQDYVLWQGQSTRPPLIVEGSDKLIMLLCWIPIRFVQVRAEFEEYDVGPLLHRHRFEVEHFPVETIRSTAGPSLINDVGVLGHIPF